MRTATLKAKHALQACCLAMALVHCSSLAQATDGTTGNVQIVQIPMKALMVWAGILVLAIANGALREAVLIPRLGHAPGLVASGLLLSSLIFGVTYLALPWLDARQPAELWTVGLGWLVLTLVFEFSFGLFRGKPLAEILQAYTFSGGNIWPLVLLVTFLAPYAATRLRDWLAS